jgi:hypothetical protein
MLPKVRENYEAFYGPMGDELPTGDIRFWDFLKRELDATGENINTLKTRGSAARNTAKRLRERIDDITDGAYAEVRGKHAFRAGLIDAAEGGENFKKMSEDQISDLVESMTPTEKYLYAGSVMNGMIERMRKSPETANAAWDMIKSPATKSKLRTIIGEEKTNKLIKAMENEIEKTRTYRATQETTQSSTFSNIVNDLALGQRNAAGRAMDIASGSPGQSLLDFIARPLVGDRATIAPQTYSNLASILTQTRPDMMQAGLQQALTQVPKAPTLAPNVGMGLYQALIPR